MAGTFSAVLRSLEFLKVVGFIQGSPLVRFYSRKLFSWRHLVNELGDRMQEDRLRAVRSGK